jgi:hypothetical protein
MLVQTVLSFEDARKRPVGKVRMIVRLSNAAINDYEMYNGVDDMNLGMDGVSVNGNGNGIGNNVVANNTLANTRSYVSTGLGGGAGAGAGAGYSIMSGRGSNAFPNPATGGGGGGRPGSPSLQGALSVAGSERGGGGGGVSYGKDFEYLLQSQEEAANELANVPVLYVSLTDIAVIDLKSVHRLVPNSPSVNLACGKVVATTSVRVRLFLVQFYFVVVVVVVYFQFIMLELEH